MRQILLLGKILLFPFCRPSSRSKELTDVTQLVYLVEAGKESNPNWPSFQVYSRTGRLGEGGRKEVKTQTPLPPGSLAELVK